MTLGTLEVALDPGTVSAMDNDIDGWLEAAYEDRVSGDWDETVEDDEFLDEDMDNDEDYWEGYP